MFGENKRWDYALLQIETLRQLAEDSDHVIITQHSATRLLERHIRYEDVLTAIATGEIIEQYPDDYPHPSCLILGVTIAEKRLHVVCGTDMVYLWIITAYYPSIEKWESDFKTRRKSI